MKCREEHEGFKGQRIVVVPRPVLEKALRDPLLRNLMSTDVGYYPKAKGHTCAREQGPLNGTELPIKQISEQLGFSEQFYFSRAFSRMHNHSPSEHRRRYATKALA